jgi:hypothetical protein
MAVDVGPESSARKQLSPLHCRAWFGHFLNAMKRSILLLLLTASAASVFSSCVPLAVGAAAGYVAHDQGYRVRNPVTKDE